MLGRTLQDFLDLKCNRVYKTVGSTPHIVRPKSKTRMTMTLCSVDLGTRKKQPGTVTRMKEFDANIIAHTAVVSSQEDISRACDGCLFSVLSSSDQQLP